jgi:hypothetical protein
VVGPELLGAGREGDPRLARRPDHKSGRGRGAVGRAQVRGVNQPIALRAQLRDESVVRPHRGPRDRLRKRQVRVRGREIRRAGLARHIDVALRVHRDGPRGVSHETVIGAAGVVAPEVRRPCGAPRGIDLCDEGIVPLGLPPEHAVEGRQILRVGVARDIGVALPVDRDGVDVVISGTTVREGDRGRRVAGCGSGREDVGKPRLRPQSEREQGEEEGGGRASPRVRPAKHRALHAEPQARAAPGCAMRVRGSCGPVRSRDASESERVFDPRNALHGRRGCAVQSTP